MSRAFACRTWPLLALAALWLGLGDLEALNLASRARAEALPEKRPSLFLSCPKECFDDFLRQKLSYFDFSRAPHLADYTLVIVRQPAGNGGERFTVSISARRETRIALASPQSFVVSAASTAHEARQILLQVLLRQLNSEMSGTPHETAFELTLPARDGVALSSLKDPWNYWVIAPELSGSGEAGSAYYRGLMFGTLTLRRVTELSKFRVRASYGRALSSYRLEDGSRIYGDLFEVDGRALYAHSIGAHFALGLVATGYTKRFENTRAHVHGGPLAELNLFPYSENATRQLRLAYQVGPWMNWYFEPNVTGHMRELRPYHALALIADVNLPWGSVQWIGQANQFLDQPERYRLSTGAVISLRVSDGLAFSLEGEAAYIRDMITLRDRAITDRELLLWIAQQPTDFAVNFKFALSYTFGSVHNTIVNPRFARVDLDEE